MNKKESLALFAKGRDAWNTWAAEMIAERKALEAAGQWTAGRQESEWNDATRAWHAAAGADFEGLQFDEPVDFSDFVFPGGAGFGEATFSGDAWFREATFSGDAGFRKATFSGGAGFREATFSGDAEFREATFSGIAEFREATFSGIAWFLQAVFKGFTSFDRAEFEHRANFWAIEAKTVFSLGGACFRAVPNFIQAHFAEAPRLDDCRIEPQGFWPSTLADVKNHFKGDRDLSARWRALKRLAIQGHDHMRELEFFKGELKARRWSEDKPLSAVFCFGLFYGWLSDFGRSIVRPLFWWATSIVCFAPLYLGAHFDRTGQPFSTLGWTIDRFVLQPFGAAVAPPLRCMAGSGDPWWAALCVSARKALLFFGLDSSDKLTLNYACLYGVVTQQSAPPGQLPMRFYLDVPNSVIAFGIAQHIISTVLLFLVLLAIRNHFRIK
jgi:hypothetical protein